MENNNPTNRPAPNDVSRGEVLALLERIRQDQLDAALAGHLAESAFYATEARLLRNELGCATSLAICA